MNYNERVSLNKLRNYISIGNLNLNDTGVYKCVSPESEFSTNLVVVQRLNKSLRKLLVVCEKMRKKINFNNTLLNIPYFTLCS